MKLGTVFIVTITVTLFLRTARGGPVSDDLQFSNLQCNVGSPTGSKLRFLTHGVREYKRQSLSKLQDQALPKCKIWRTSPKMEEAAKLVDSVRETVFRACSRVQEHDGSEPLLFGKQQAGPAIDHLMDNCCPRWQQHGGNFRRGDFSCSGGSVDVLWNRRQTSAPVNPHASTEVNPLDFKYWISFRVEACSDEVRCVPKPTQQWVPSGKTQHGLSKGEYKFPDDSGAFTYNSDSAALYTEVCGTPDTGNIKKGAWTVTKDNSDVELYEYPPDGRKFRPIGARLKSVDHNPAKVVTKDICPGILQVYQHCCDGGPIAERENFECVGGGATFTVMDPNGALAHVTVEVTGRKTGQSYHVKSDANSAPKIDANSGKQKSPDQNTLTRRRPSPK
ncbi:unnamed protein product [Calypogeia fissa]